MHQFQLEQVLLSTGLWWHLNSCSPIAAISMVRESEEASYWCKCFFYNFKRFLSRFLSALAFLADYAYEYLPSQFFISYDHRHSHHRSCGRDTNTISHHHHPNTARNSIGASPGGALMSVLITFLNTRVTCRCKAFSFSTTSPSCWALRNRSLSLGNCCVFFCLVFVLSNILAPFPKQTRRTYDGGRT